MTGMSEESFSKARACALRLLKVRPRTEAELRQRLMAKGFGAAVQENLLEEFRRKGLMDDAKFAQYYVNQAVFSKPMGRRALLHGLKARGVSEEMASEAVALGTKDQDELETARQLAAGRFSRLRGLAAPVVQRRLFGFLSRRGFSSDVVYKVVREVTAVHSGMP